MTTPPSGTVTFLFTDIEGSTRLWDAHPTEMSEAQAHHDEFLRGAIARRDGYVFSHAGDGLGASFSSPTAAIATALEVQHGLASYRWPEAVGALRVRMGMHTGTAEERDGDYFGTSVNRAARPDVGSSSSTTPSTSSMPPSTSST
ncbi:MAG TPA: adenylate/guanylate cyclase domain-containing protein [Acidimicrobiia bacterium]|nr:adenylate/guanylate cyclase domain-containing protein [Acidimicrobiia bacterium]